VLAEYLALRRALGYKLQRAGQMLAEFVAYLDRVGSEHITIGHAMAWATRAPDTGSSWRAQRLGAVRCFARYAQALDARHEVPPGGLLPPGQRRMPYVYSEADVIALLRVSPELGSPLRSTTFAVLIGMLWATGLRVGEAIRLDRDDVDLAGAVITVCKSKLGKTRLVPLHPSTVEALGDYCALRDRLLAHRSSSFFTTTAGTRLRSGNLSALFTEALRLAQLQPRPWVRRPRLGDLRHAFAVHTILDWHISGVDVEARLPLLSTFLGHANPASTYWYLTASPELLTAAARRLRHDEGGGS
jgi:integrase